MLLCSPEGLFEIQQKHIFLEERMVDMGCQALTHHRKLALGSVFHKQAASSQQPDPWAPGCQGPLGDVCWVPCLHRLRCSASKEGSVKAHSMERTREHLTVGTAAPEHTSPQTWRCGELEVLQRAARRRDTWRGWEVGNKAWTLNGLWAQRGTQGLKGQGLRAFRD